MRDPAGAVVRRERGCRAAALEPPPRPLARAASPTRRRWRRRRRSRRCSRARRAGGGGSARPRTPPSPRPSPPWGYRRDPSARRRRAAGAGRGVRQRSGSRRRRRCDPGGRTAAASRRVGFSGTRDRGASSVARASASTASSSCLRAASCARRSSSSVPGGASHFSRPVLDPDAHVAFAKAREELRRRHRQISISSRSLPRARAPRRRRRRGRPRSRPDRRSWAPRTGGASPTSTPERRAQRRDDLSGHQRVAAEVEEVVVNPGRRDPERVGPDGRDLGLGRRARSDVRRSRGRRVGIRRGQRLAVDLAVGGQRQRGEQHEVRRHHVLGQLRL